MNDAHKDIHYPRIIENSLENRKLTKPGPSRDEATPVDDVSFASKVLVGQL